MTSLDDLVDRMPDVGPAATEPHARQREDRAARILWSGLLEPGDRVGGALIRARGAAEAWRLVEGSPSADVLAAEADIGRNEAKAAIERWAPRLGSRTAEEALERAERHRVAVLVPGDDDWPAALDDLGDHAPPCLWVRGGRGWSAGRDPSVAIVGARAATSYGEHVAGEISAGLAAAGVVVVSGAAYGIDGAAHRAALASGGTTLAFLAGGCDRAYPSGHTDLLERIAASGAVVSEVPCGAAPTKWRFLQRNRLIAAATHATVVVEAGIRSGSLNTAGHAASLGRPIGAVPGPVTSSASAGTHRLLREFDAVCVTGVDDVRELIGLDPGNGTVAPSPEAAGRIRVLDALSDRVPHRVEDVAARSGMSGADVRAHLGTLMLEGAAEAVADRWRRVR
ncbi:DNA-processing protein DprA [Microbacterium caowuchunii]|uniref:DNA-protecting protein DprA n=1 Tax=Microbacterium caowuchunii TaxID=2614638 RepID=A0A5N0TKP5_9MICO|nr:DNA-processing protein DprA [Microbacterium caowuchunii]KAA9134998.1 DNA-protecting protein DprA [Microbacterium caowuchunii]